MHPHNYLASLGSIKKSSGSGPRYITSNESEKRAVPRKCSADRDGLTLVVFFLGSYSTFEFYRSASLSE